MVDGVKSVDDATVDIGVGMWVENLGDVVDVG